MNHMDDLDREFPEVKMFGPQCIEASVGPGWVPLVRQALQAISRAGGLVGQIKQKFGGLRVYWGPSLDDMGMVIDIDRNVIADTDAAITAVEEASFSTCEECGRPAVFSRRLYATLCGECSK